MTIKAKAWNTFSQWIRKRDKRCVTCGSTNQLQAGHFYHGVLDFDEENINAQCKQCNHFKSGNLALYSIYLLKKLGLKKFNELNLRHYQAMKGEIRSAEDYKKLIELYD
jgi:hypothetical protein